jgi:hypothetical protein
VELRASELAMLLDGIDLRSVKRVKRFPEKKFRREEQFAGGWRVLIASSWMMPFHPVLPDDPAILKQIITSANARAGRTSRRANRIAETSRRKQQIEEKLRIEVELLRLKKLYYGPRADRLQTTRAT